MERSGIGVRTCLLDQDRQGQIWSSLKKRYTDTYTLHTHIGPIGLHTYIHIYTLLKKATGRLLYNFYEFCIGLHYRYMLHTISAATIRKMEVDLSSIFISTDKLS